MYVRSREVPLEWERALRELSPITGSSSYLILKWEFVLGKVKGQWVDRSRWVLYECQPAWAIPTGLRRMLEDTPPRLLPEGRARARRMFVDDWSHEYYRQHRVFARPFWVIQGRNGGVPAGFTDREQEILKAMGEPTDPAPVGSLPYAPFDGRVVAQVLQRDRLLRNDMNLDALVNEKRIAFTVAQEYANAERQHRAEFVSWFKGTLAPSADFLTWYTRRTEADMQLRKSTRAENRAAHDFEQRYIETGQLAQPSDYSSERVVLSA